jgi:phosphoenolpyruvate carboxykinase (GTP)
MATAPLALPALPTMSPAVSEWVASVRQLTQPERVHWCEGSDDEYRALIAELEASGELQKLNEAH